ncbi:hypothetical protein SH449x_005457 [Pirellulaceae bacterium SH449]
MIDRRDIVFGVPRASIFRELHLALTALFALWFTQSFDGFCSRRLILSDLILCFRDALLKEGSGVSYPVGIVDLTFSYSPSRRIREGRVEERSRGEGALGSLTSRAFMHCSAFHPLRATLNSPSKGE